ncbi:glucosidase family protein [Mucilaginibacter gilvus]|uniref:Glycosyl hydrolase 36 catalytic domain-containing protein n=1 Tax=Mucilaginibacter gilvus TaxID=2305909 RepID=A0A444MVC8_9SPHI|nr:hypothetical protein [Mucilaginibacter gilvus]RWY57515.1 hypothetical protein EPL05_03020 [Mucilaginibacter gilvus]
MLRKNILFLLVFVASLLPGNALFAQGIGSWSFTKAGLPCYEYTGRLPFIVADKNGKDADQPEDPFFLLGNYRMALITHASGVYQFFTAERAWARVNSASQTNYGANEADVTISNSGGAKRIRLTGINSIASDSVLTHKYFGVGFARYTYQLDDGVACTRVLSVKPSQHINTGNPSFVITVTIKNGGKAVKHLIYRERMRVNYVMNSLQYTDPGKRPIVYPTDMRVDQAGQIGLAVITAKKNSFLPTPGKNERFIYDVAPPAVFMYARNFNSSYHSEVRVSKDTLSSVVTTSLKPGESKIFQVVIGLADGKSYADISKQVNELLLGTDQKNPENGLYANQWKSRLPDLSLEKNEILKREMLWNAHMMEASAKYSSYYKETFIPQGTVYSYYFGDNISNRDHLAAILPLCYTNPELARSAIRYVMAHTESDGELKRGNTGYGYSQPSFFKESDEQLYFFNTLAEYLLITKNYSFLNERVTLYPAETGHKEVVLNVVKKYFIYLRDEIGQGPNGLVRMLNSDWSDSFFHKYSPNVYGGSAESHLNSAMLLAVFPKLTEALKLSGNPAAKDLIIAMEKYRVSISDAFMEDLGDRKFAARAYLSKDLKFGLDNVCIEPQGYLLQIPGLPVERKKQIYEYVKSKLLTPEKIGIRTREKPLWGGNPDGEDGGIWYSLEYPVLLGVATFDKVEARRLLLKFSFDNFAKQYPNYWVGQWTAPDEMNSTLSREGLYAFWVPSPDRKRAFQGYCSHPHTWPLFCYFKLKN